MYLLLRWSHEGKAEWFGYNSIIAVYEAKIKWESEGYNVEFYVRTELKL